VESWSFDVRAAWRRVARPWPANQLAQPDERRFAVAAWRDAPDFTDAERAALALTEAITRLSGRADPVPDEIWHEAARHDNEPALAALVITIVTINAWNRINATTRRVAGALLSCCARGPVVAKQSLGGGAAWV